MMATSYDAAKSGSDVPSVIVTHESEWSSYEALLQPQVRFQFATAGYPKIDGGFVSMMFRNTPLIADEYATDGYMLFLNEKYLKFVNLKHPKHPTDKRGFTYVPLKEGIDQDYSYKRVSPIIVVLLKIINKGLIKSTKYAILNIYEKALCKVLHLVQEVNQATRKLATQES